MVTIETIETFIVDVPTIRQHVLAMATMRTQAMVFVHVRCSDGVEGIGEGTTIGGLSYGDESPEGIKLTIDRHVAPLLHGSDASPARATMLLRKSIVGNHFAKNAVETALFDAAGKRAGVPVSELLGGRVRDRLPVLWTLASGDTARDIAEAETMIDQRRHKAFKLKIGKRDLVEDVAHVAAIKRALGDLASIRVDVNQAWDEATAKRGVAMLADADVDLIEQPISGANVSGMARLTAMGRTAIMADEGLRGPIDALRHATDAAADVFAVKIAQSGGLRAGAAVAGIAEAAGIGLYGGTMLEGPIGSIASAHLFATIDEFDVSEDEFWHALNFMASAAPEFGLFAAGLGFEHFLDMRMDAADAEAGIEGGTPRTIEGPLYVKGAPRSKGFARLDDGADDGEVLIMHGRVVDKDGKPVAGAIVDVWHANTLGNYSYFDKTQSEFNLRRQIETDEEGRYKFRSIVPSGYAVPKGGTTEALLDLVGRHGNRPAHVHFFVSASGYRHLTTQINIDGDPYLHDDFAYATRDDLIPPIERKADPAAIHAEGLNTPFTEIAFDFTLITAGEAEEAEASSRSRVALAA